MPHVFVESNWLFGMPNICLGEARQAILTKCQPRKEANARRRFLSWAEPAGDVTVDDVVATRRILDKYENSVKRALNELDGTLRQVAEFPCVNVFGLDDDMLELATKLALDGVA